MPGAQIRPDLSVFQPRPIVELNSERAGWRGAFFLQWTAPFFGSFDGDGREGSPLLISWAQTPQKVRWRPRKSFEDVPLAPVIYMPGQGGHGEWQGAATTLLLHVSRKFIDQALQPARPLARPECSEGSLKKVEHLVALIRADVAAQNPAGPALGEYLAAGVVQALFPDDERSAALEGRGTSRRQIARACELIEARLSERLSLVDLATEIGMSTRQLCRAFKSMTGLAPHEYIVRRRIERAAALIALGELSLTEIALIVGFSSHAHMVAAFRRVTGLPPSHFRND